MKRRLALWLLGAVAGSAQPYLEMTSGPTSANHNTNYYIEARGWDSWGGLSVTVYKNGNYFASNYGNSPVTAGSNTSDSGPTSVTFRVDGLNDSWQSDTIYHYVSVSAPPNDPPTIQWVTAPTYVPVNQNFTVQAKGMDANGNLTNVFVWREWTPFAFNGGGNGYENTSDGNGHSQSTPGTITFQAQAQDSNGAASSVIYHTVHIYVPNDPPTIQWINAPSAAYVNQWFNVQARGDDANGNLAWVNVWKGGSPFAFNGGGNGYQSFSDNNAAFGATPGTIQFSAQSGDSVSATSQLIYHNVTINNRAPNMPSITPSGTGVTNNGGGQFSMFNEPPNNQITVSSTMTDPDGNLTNHTIYYQQVTGANPDPGGWVALTNGTPSNPSSSTVSTTQTMLTPGRWDFHANGHDGYLSTGGASFTLYVYGLTNGSTFISQVVNGQTNPTSLNLNTGQTVSATVTLRNSGTKPWNNDGTPHKLGSQSPMNNTNWGLNRVNLPSTPINPVPQPGNTAAFTFNITAPTVPGNYTFRWRMREDGIGWFGATTPVVTITVIDTIAPTAPTSLNSTGKTHATVSLAWTAATDNSGSVTYAIYRNGGGTPVGTTTATTFTDTGLTPETTYSYTVKAYDAANLYSNASNSINVTTNADPNADDDGDGIPNGWESANGLNPNNPNDALLDPDGDGLSNAAEYNRGTNPQSYDAGTSTLGAAIPAGWPATPGGSSHAVGMTAGSLAVDKNGAATYSIPLWVVPGTAGMEPQLALNYSSQSGSGWLGFGWSLSGLSAITRGPQTKATDNNVTGVNFTASDRFYLDGQRLIEISGNYGENGTEYRTEIDSISKIVSYNSAGTGPAWFRVWTKSGLIIEFGNTTNSAAEAQGRSEIMTWAVNRISDTKGNFIDFVYSENSSTGEHRIDRINYTGNTGASLSPYASVRFTYENRTDTFEGYVFGSKVSRTQRLKTIATYYGETKAREYTFDYTERAHTGRSLLTAVREKASDNREYPALTFEYDEAEAGWTELDSSWGPPALLAQQGAAPKGTGFVDLNGDGRPDFVQYHVANNWTNLGQGAWLNTVNGWVPADGSNGSPDYRPAMPLARDGVIDSGMRFVDLNGDGFPDLVNLLSGTAWLNVPGTGFVVSTTWSFPAVTLPPEANPLNRTVNHYTYDRSLGSFADMDGDGRPDFIGYYGTFAIYFADNDPYAETFIVAEGLRNTGSGWEAAPNYGGMSNYPEGFRILDLNADGRLDAVQHWRSAGNTLKRDVILGTGNGWDRQLPNTAGFDAYVPPVIFNVGTSTSYNAPYGTEIIDFNGDGLPDLVQYNNVASPTAWFGTGAGWVQATYNFHAPAILSNGSIAQGMALIDVNADGIVDLVQGWGSTRNVWLGTGRGWSNAVSAHNVIRQVAQQGLENTGTDFIDLNGDGAIDQVWHWQDPNGTVRGAALNKSKPADRLKKVTNGFGVAAQITYAPLTERDGGGGFTVYDKGTGGPADTANVIGPMYVVKTVSNDDGAGGQHAVNYRYGGLRAHRLRGSLGFEWMQSTDARTGIVSKTTFSQQYPFIGMVATSETKSGSTVLSTSSITYADQNSTGAVRLPYAATVTQSSNDLNGAAISSSTTTTAINAYGNVTSIVVADNLTIGFSKTTSNTYTDNPSLWLLGRLTQSSVASTAPGKSPLTRTSAFTYHATTGLLETETVEPYDNTLKVTTTYGHDAYGNRTSVSVAGAAITVDASGNLTPGANVSRTSTTAYDSQGRFPVSSTNALTHTETYAHDPLLGVMTSLTGANSLTTTWTYDSFGVKTRETRADGTITDYRLRWAGSGAPSGSHTFVEVEFSGAAPSLVFNDNFGRQRWSLTINGDGKIVYQQTAYDNMGRAYAQTNPYFNDGSPVYWTQTVSYDLLNRPLSVQTPDDNVSHVTTTHGYNGRVTSVTDPLGRVARSTVNTQGWLIEAVRNDNGGANDRAVVTHDYDALGNLTTTTAHGATTTLVYDLRGRKTSMAEPNMGTWHYRYNIFGELIWQKDAKGQITTLVYDALGRLVSRTERNDADTANETTTWTYDTSPTKGLGKLHTVAAPGGFAETHTYDAYGRPTTVTRTIDSTNYALTQTYDSFSRPLKTVYPTGFQTRQVYNAFGYLKEVRKHVAGDDGKPNNQLAGHIYWMADKYAVTGQVDGEILGNGLVNDRVYSAKTGRLLGAAVGRGIETAGPFSVQTLHYTRDAVGNVTGRVDTTTGVNRTESFTYDALDRLTGHTVNGGTPVTVSYDAQGNITQKSDVGSYLYGSGRPHAVSGVTGGPLGTQTYAYDANGNLTSGGGRTISWTSFNQARTVTKGSFTSTFSFGANRERVKQVSHLGTTIYVGSLYEKFTAGSAFEHKHYIYAPTGRVAVHTERSDLSQDLRYFHSDGLGSITAVSNELGAVVKRFAFDAWGKRIDPGTGNAITGSTSAGFSRGFTDHEQLDDLGLVHMNGRVYDPVLARFLSADPYVDSVTDSQSLNRYSYVSNNPLGYVDPSGYFKLSFKTILKIVAVVAVAYFTGVWAQGAWGTTTVATSTSVSATGSVTVGTSWASSALLSAGFSAGATNGIIAGFAGGFASGFAGSLLNGGSLGDAFKAGAIGSVAGAITGGVAGRYQSKWGLEKIAAKSGAGGISSEIQGGDWRTGAAFALAMESLAWVNYEARQTQIKDSQKYTDPRTGLKPNATGRSANFWRDKFKLGGGRWKPWLSLDEQLNDPSPLGGVQGQDGLIKIGPVRVGYSPGSFGDNLVEAYAGIHDALNSWFWYDANGNALNRAGFMKYFGETLNFVNVPISTPFAAGVAYSHYSYINAIPAATRRRDDRP